METGSHISDDTLQGDALCFALARDRTAATVYSVLNEFIPGYKKIAGDYAFNHEVDLVFESEDGILNYLEMNNTKKGVIHWNKHQDNPDGIMVGAYFLPDGKLILSLTLPASGIKEVQYLETLKRFLGTGVGVIYYDQFPVLDELVDVMVSGAKSKREILARMEKFEGYFGSLSETNELFKPEFDCAKKIKELIRQNDTLTPQDVEIILKVYNDTNDGRHYNGSGWLDYRLHLIHLLSIDGFKVEEERLTGRVHYSLK
jgi:hypothetical protein